MSEPITNLADAVAALGALPMGVDLAPLELSEQQIEALAEAGNRVVNDAVHERLCMCDAWPERCVSTGNYYMGAWDVSGLEDALPAVLALWEQMRGGELLALRARVAELESERHSTNEALDDAVQALRERPDGITRLIAPTQALREDGVYPRGSAPRVQQTPHEDPHDGPLHHSYLVPRDLPEPGGA